MRTRTNHHDKYNAKASLDRVMLNGLGKNDAKPSTLAVMGYVMDASTSFNFASDNVPYKQFPLRCYS